MLEENTNINDEEKVVYYRVINDAYKQKYKITTWIFNKILKHMLNKMKEECTIFYLMQEIQKNRENRE